MRMWRIRSWNVNSHGGHGVGVFCRQQHPCRFPLRRFKKLFQSVHRKWWVSVFPLQTSTRGSEGCGRTQNHRERRQRGERIQTLFRTRPDNTEPVRVQTTSEDLLLRRIGPFRRRGPVREDVRGEPLDRLEGELAVQALRYPENQSFTRKWYLLINRARFLTKNEVENFCLSYWNVKYCILWVDLLKTHSDYNHGFGVFNISLWYIYYELGHIFKENHG